MKNIIKNIKLGAFLICSVLFFQCDDEVANPDFVSPANPDISNANDTYLYENNGKSLFERYGTATRWRWNDNFIGATEKATPIESEFVIPTTKLIDYLWIGPFVDNGGEAFINELFPPELQYIGSFIFQDDGTIKLGFAEGGARVSLLDLNSYDLQEEQWLRGTAGILPTIHHEFTHIVHQNYGLPVGFNTISEAYIGQNWSDATRDEAIKLGMVRNYGALNEFEDFCEIISHYLVMDPDTFEADFITQQDCSTLTSSDAILNCFELNEGRKKIQEKVGLAIEFYKNTFNIDLVQVRETMQERIQIVMDTNEIPES